MPTRTDNKPVNQRSSDRRPYAIYLYCLADGARLHSLTEQGLDPDQPVRVRAFGDVAAVLSPVLLAEFIGAEGESNLQDPQWVGPRACRHERVVEAAMAASPVLPARFGTLFSSEAGLEQLIGRNHAEIIRFFGRMAARSEWSIKGYFHRKSAVETLARELSRAQAEVLERLSPGARYFQQRKILGEAERALGPWVARTEEEVRQRLAPHLEDLRRRRLMAREATGKNQDMLFNWAVLVAGDGIEPLHRCIEQTNDESHARGLVLEISGPWPPYSFCPTLEPV